MFDRRIYHRQMKALKGFGYEITLIAPGEKDLISEGIKIISIPPPRKRINKLYNHSIILKKALEEQADAYHLHDPDLLLPGLILQIMSRKPVIYDAHEDYTLAAKSSRNYIPKILRGFVAIMVDIIERFFAKRMAGVIAVYENRLEKIKNLKKSSLIVPNYPDVTLFKQVNLEKKDLKKLLHLGTLSKNRGQDTLIDLMVILQKLDPEITLDIVGFFVYPDEENDFFKKLEKYNLTNLNYIGRVPYTDVPKYLERSSIGLVPWFPTEQHILAGSPTKMFEYMAASMITIASNFGIFQNIFMENDSGLLFDPNNVNELVQKILKLVNDPDTMKKKMIRSRKMFEEKYNWNVEVPKFLEFYATILS